MQQWCSLCLLCVPTTERVGDEEQQWKINAGNVGDAAEEVLNSCATCSYFSPKERPGWGDVATCWGTPTRGRAPRPPTRISCISFSWGTGAPGSAPPGAFLAHLHTTTARLLPCAASRGARPGPSISKGAPRRPGRAPHGQVHCRLSTTAAPGRLRPCSLLPMQPVACAPGATPRSPLPLPPCLPPAAMGLEAFPRPQRARTQPRKMVEAADDSEIDAATHWIHQSTSLQQSALPPGARPPLGSRPPPLPRPKARRSKATRGPSSCRSSPCSSPSQQQDDSDYEDAVSDADAEWAAAAAALGRAPPEAGADSGSHQADSPDAPAYKRRRGSSGKAVKLRNPECVLACLPAGRTCRICLQAFTSSPAGCPRCCRYTEEERAELAGPENAWAGLGSNAVVLSGTAEHADGRADPGGGAGHCCQC